MRNFLHLSSRYIDHNCTVITYIRQRRVIQQLTLKYKVYQLSTYYSNRKLQDSTHKYRHLLCPSKVKQLQPISSDNQTPSLFLCCPYTLSLSLSATFSLSLQLHLSVSLLSLSFSHSPYFSLTLSATFSLSLLLLLSLSLSLFSLSLSFSLSPYFSLSIC